MSTSDESTPVEQIIKLIQKLPVEDQLQIVRYVVEALAEADVPDQSYLLIYGQFKGEKMSRDEDFSVHQVAEREFNGS